MNLLYKLQAKYEKSPFLSYLTQFLKFKISFSTNLLSLIAEMFLSKNNWPNIHTFGIKGRGFFKMLSYDN